MVGIYWLMEALKMMSYEAHPRLDPETAIALVRTICWLNNISYSFSNEFNTVDLVQKKENHELSK